MSAGLRPKDHRLVALDKTYIYMNREAHHVLYLHEMSTQIHIQTKGINKMGQCSFCSCKDLPNLAGLSCVNKLNNLAAAIFWHEKAFFFKV
jgi:hypothetical protein